MNRGFVMVGVLGVVVVASCQQETVDRRRQLLESWGQNDIVPLYQQVESRAAELHTAAKTLCADANDTTLLAARAMWWELRAPWKQAELLAFGPYSDEPWRFGVKIDAWPVRPDSIEKVLAGEGPIQAQSLGVFTKGMPAVEYLLYPVGEDVISTFQSTGRHCEYLLALTSDLADNAAGIRKAWDPDGDNYLRNLVMAGTEGTTFDSAQLALGEIVHRMAFTLENIRADKLGKPLGKAPEGEAQPEVAESQFSDRSIDDIRDNLNGIERFYFGDKVNGHMGLEDYLRSLGKTYAVPMAEKLAVARTALDNIPGSLVTAVEQHPQSVIETMDRLAELQVLIQVDIVGALALTPSFNDNDGD